MRKLVAATLFAALTTFTAALALRASETTIGLAAVAGITVLVAWFAGQHTTEDESGLALANPASTLALTMVGRSSGAMLLPVIAAHFVGAAIGGLAALGLDDRLGDTLLWADPTLVATAAVVLIVGIAATWLLFAIDSQIGEPYAAIPPLLAGAALPVSMAVALNPAAVLGLAMANLIPWDVACVAAVTAFVAAVVGSYTARVISPTV